MRYFCKEYVLEEFNSQGKFWLHMRNNTYFAKGGRIPLLSLNEIDEKSRPTIINGNFVNNP